MTGASERERVDALKTLGVPRSAREPQVRAAYLRLARELHPDVNPGDEAAAARFQQVAAAYEILRRHFRTPSAAINPLRRQKPAEFDQSWWSAFGDRV